LREFIAPASLIAKNYYENLLLPAGLITTIICACGLVYQTFCACGLDYEFFIVPADLIKKNLSCFAGLITTINCACGLVYENSFCPRGLDFIVPAGLITTIYCTCGPLFARIYCACGFDYKNMLCLRAWSREIFVPAGLFTRILCLWLGLRRPAWLLVASHNFISQALFVPTQHVRYFLLSIEEYPRLVYFLLDNTSTH